MKWMLLIILSTTLVGCSAGQTARDQGGKSIEASSQDMKDAGYKRYGIESGIVEYEMSGARKGTETLYFDQWGMREAKYTKAEIKIMGFTQKENKLTLTEGEWIYAIDLEARTGTKTKNPMLKQITEGSGSKDLVEIGEKMMKGMGGEKIGTEEIAGKMCDIWEIKNAGSKTWIWKGVPLKTQVNMAPMNITMAATKIEAGISIPEDKFAIPSDVTITEGPDVEKLLKRMKPGNQ